MYQTDVYPSRIGEAEKILPRRDPVVYNRQSQKPFALNEAQLKHYEDNGFLVLDEYLSDWVGDIKQEMQSLKTTMAGREELYTEPGSNSLRTLFNPCGNSRLLDRFSRQDKLLDIVEQLLGEGVYLMQSRINVKPAYYGKSFAWHSDFETWHVEDGMPRMRAVTAWLMLDDSTPYNGPLYVVPKSHRQYVSCQGITGEKNYLQSLKQQKAGVPQPETISKLLEHGGIKGVYGKAGTLVLHECNLLHGSPDNISHQNRSLMMMVYNHCSNACSKPFSGLAKRPDYLSNPDTKPLKRCFAKQAA